MTRVLLLAFLLLAAAANGQSYSKISNPTSCKAKINAKAKSTQSISANFEETAHSSMYNNPKKGSGKLKYKKSNKIRWEHTAPNEQIVLISGSKVRLKENGKEVKNVASNQVIKKVQSLMLQLFSGDFLNEKEFKIAYYENGKNYKLILNPKSSRMSRYISSIEMIFSKSTLALDQLTLLESEADKVVYSFSSVTFNKTISDSNFTSF